MNDLISRQAAIDAVNNAFDRETLLTGFVRSIAVRAIRDMPSTQPGPCEDAVSRRRLLSDLKELTAAWGKYPVMAEQIKGVEAAIGYVETIPSVTPERKKGKWKRRIVDSGYNADWICSECGYRVKTDFVNYNFCPNCGADMRGEHDG